MAWQGNYENEYASIKQHGKSKYRIMRERTGSWRDTSAILAESISVLCLPVKKIKNKWGDPGIHSLKMEGNWK